MKLLVIMIAIKANAFNYDATITRADKTVVKHSNIKSLVLSKLDVNYSCDFFTMKKSYDKKGVSQEFVLSCLHNKDRNNRFSSKGVCGVNNKYNIKRSDNMIIELTDQDKSVNINIKCNN